jgi:hypothetical protein
MARLSLETVESGLAGARLRADPDAEDAAMSERADASEETAGVLSRGGDGEPTEADSMALALSAASRLGFEFVRATPSLPLLPSSIASADARAWSAWTSEAGARPFCFADSLVASLASI